MILPYFSWFLRQSDNQEQNRKNMSLFSYVVIHGAYKNNGLLNSTEISDFPLYRQKNKYISTWEEITQYHFDDTIFTLDHCAFAKKAIWSDLLDSKEFFIHQWRLEWNAFTQKWKPSVFPNWKHSVDLFHSQTRKDQNKNFSTK